MYDEDNSRSSPWQHLLIITSFPSFKGENKGLFALFQFAAYFVRPRYVYLHQTRHWNVLYMIHDKKQAIDADRGQQEAHRGPGPRLQYYHSGPGEGGVSKKLEPFLASCENLSIFVLLLPPLSTD